MFSAEDKPRSSPVEVATTSGEEGERAKVLNMSDILMDADKMASLFDDGNEHLRTRISELEREIETIGIETSESLHTASANSESSTPPSDQNVSREGNTSPTKSA